MVQTDGERESVPSLHSMPVLPSISPHSRDGIISMYRGMAPVWSGLVVGVSSQQRASWLYFCAVLIEMWARDLR